ncbi:MAG: sulfatase-like hydrolase/transferase [Paracoccaceae bacterium]|nr:sulfatase-like hydrolase/transferase [Paracoccaceae bacterium]MDE2917192.1 sulfatase-like hydrolase/transferase [Paracoccaceae bacterium]
MTKQPNIIYFMTDQHRADWLGCSDHPVVRTPNIDSLANKGSRFTNFYVTTPVCMPNRAAIFTGRYPSVNGLRHNGLPLTESAITFVDLLRDAGYHTASIGKSHLQPFTDRPVGSEGRNNEINNNFPEALKPNGSTYDMEHPETYEGDQFYEVPTPYYGFDHVRMVTNHGDTCGGHYLQWLKKQTNEWFEIRDRANQYPHDFENPQAFRTRIPEELYPTSYIREEAKKYLKGRTDSKEPFFAFVSFPDPHHPFTPPGKYWDMYDPKEFKVDLPYEAHQNPPIQLRCWKRLMDQGIHPGNPQQAFMAPHRQIREAMALTAGMITMIDEAIGNILDLLDETGQSDNTIIIFNSDHGDYMGSFSLLLKGPFPHVSVNKVPFIWVEPRQQVPKLIDGLAASMDIGPSILDRCNILPFFGMQGLSFMPRIHSGVTVRNSVLIEHEENKIYPGLPSRPNIRNLITDSHRLTIYKGLDTGELYDLNTDSNETRNLWDDPDCMDLKSELMFRLNQTMLEAIEPGPRPLRYA